MQVQVIRSVEVLVEAAEEYASKVFGFKDRLADIFQLEVVPELLLGTAWVKVLAVFIPAGIDNRLAVDALIKAGFKKSAYEEVDVMKYDGSAASNKPQLLLIDFSIRPDLDTMGLSPNSLVKTKKPWLNLKGYVVATGIHRQVTGKALDPETTTWFPEDRLPDSVRVANGYWHGDVQQVRFYWNTTGCENGDSGARLAIPVPLKPQA